MSAAILEEETDKGLTDARGGLARLCLATGEVTPVEEMSDEAFPHSLGVHSGPPEQVAIDFEPAVSDYVRARGSERQ